MADAGVDQVPPDDDAGGGWIRLLGVAVVGGAAVGIIGGLFRLALAAADVLRTGLVEWARTDVVVRGLVPVAAAAAAVALARLLVRWAPEASGSGVQLVEADMRAELPGPPWRVIPAKFIGGVLSMGSGMALGREGPTIQMGAAVGQGLSSATGADAHDQRTLTAALGGAGLGVAFSAPIGGSLFVFEEVAHAFRTRLIVATLLGTGTAVAVASVLVGRQPVFPIPPVEPLSLAAWPLIVVLGVALGALGVAYNALVVRLLELVDRVRHLPVEVTAGCVGALVGVVGVVAPALVGGGESLAETVLLGGLPVSALVLLLVVRWFLGPISYSVGTPGGLFAPLLVVGAALGALLGSSANLLLPTPLNPTALAIVGMSTFFAATVRAPFTGVVLVVEMTATTSLVAPMAVAAACAVVVATALRGAPIYDTLRIRSERRRAVT